MRFQTSALASFPPPPAGLLAARLNDTGLQWDMFDGPSGESGIIIQGGTPNKTVRITQLIASWGGLEIAGRLEVRSNPDKPLCVLFQTAPSGTLTVPLNDLPLTIGNFGLRCDNNGVEGNYVVIAYYHLEVE